MRRSHAALVWAVLLLFVLVCSLSFAQENAGERPRVLDPLSMDPSVDPCVDFYTYALRRLDKEQSHPAGSVELERVWKAAGR